MRATAHPSVGIPLTVNRHNGGRGVVITWKNEVEGADPKWWDTFINTESHHMNQ